jgi:hypothetical protein
LIIFFAFIPFIALGELRRMVGVAKFNRLFFDLGRGAYLERSTAGGQE